MHFNLTWMCVVTSALLFGCGGGEEPPSPTRALIQKTAQDRAEASGRAQASTIAPAKAAKVALPVNGNVLANYGFENGTANWTETSTAGYSLISDFSQYAANTGSQYAWLGGYNGGTDTLWQEVLIPATGPQAKLQFWYQITTSETSTATAYDTVDVAVFNATTGAKLATLATFSNLDQTGGWARSPQYDLTAYVGQRVLLKFTALLDASNSSSFLLDDVAITALDPTSITPQNGWWWNPAEGGRGFAIERQGNQLFLAAFLYDTNGAATWYVSTLTRQLNGAYTGPMMRYAGGQTLLGAYKSPTTVTTAANATLTFNTATTGSLLVQPTDGSSARTIAVERFPISSPAFTASNANFQSGWWWNEAQGGRGFFIEVQGSQAFIGSFMYDGAGQPIWYTSVATLQNGQSVSGILQQYSNGQSLTGSYKSPTLASSSPGTMTFSFTSGDSATMVRPDGAAVALKRFIFNSTETTPVCQAPQTLQNGVCTTPTAPPASGTSTFAGTYTVSSAGVTVSFTVDSGGDVTSCSDGTLIVCRGSVSSNGALIISGNDGLSPIDTAATLTGSINSMGEVSGTYTGNSTSEGPFSGYFSGSRTGSGSTTGGSSSLECFNSLLGSWYHSVGGTWTFSVEGNTNKAKLILNSLNYGPAAQQITELAVSSCAGSSMSYKITRAALINTIDPSYAYDKTPENAPSAYDWSKVYSQSYTLSGYILAFGNYTYTKQ